MPICSLRLGVLLLVTTLRLSAQDAALPTDDPGELVRRLGSESFDERRRADDLLFRLGLPAVPSLEEALGSEDLEVRTRARVLLEDLRYRFLVGSALEQLSPQDVSELLSRRPSTRRTAALRLSDAFSRRPPAYAEAAPELLVALRRAREDWPESAESFAIALTYLGDVEAGVALCERLGREGRFEHGIGLFVAPGAYLGEVGAQIETMARTVGDARLAAVHLLLCNITDDSDRPTLAPRDVERTARLALEVDVPGGSARGLARDLLLIALGSTEALDRLPGSLEAVQGVALYEALLERALLEPDSHRWRTAVLDAACALEPPRRPLLARMLAKGEWFEGRTADEVEALFDRPPR